MRTAHPEGSQRIQHNPASICQYRIDSPCKVCTSRFPGVRHTQVLQNSFEKLRGACSPSGESPHLSFIAVPTSRTVSELTGSLHRVLATPNTLSELHRVLAGRVGA